MVWKESEERKMSVAISNSRKENMSGVKMDDGVQEDRGKRGVRFLHIREKYLSFRQDQEVMIKNTRISEMWSSEDQVE